VIFDEAAGLFSPGHHLLFHVSSVVFLVVRGVKSRDYIKALVHTRTSDKNLPFCAPNNLRFCAISNLEDYSEEYNDISTG
jgi:hypothetical protein